MKALKIGILAATLLIVAIAPATAEVEGMKPVGQVKFTGGTELAASGKYIYAGELNGHTDRNEEPTKGGIHIIDVSKGMKEVGFLHCPGTDNDVEVVKPGLIIVSFSQNQCALGAGNGLMTVDVRNPKQPRVLGFVNTGKNHTHKPLPGTSLVYTAGGGLSGGPAAGPAIVDVKNPAKPEVVAKPQTITTDCHDISFHITKDSKLGFCAGAIGTGEVQIWDVSDPLAPVSIGKVVNPAIQYSHYAVASTDGKLLAIDDEAFAAHDCNTGQSPTGRIWIYDISNPATPIPMGSFAAQRGGDGQTNIGTFPGWTTSWCLSHGLDWQPDTHNIAVTWFTGGVSVLNVDTPSTPQEVAYFQAEDSTTYSALWHNGRLYTNDMRRGVDGFEVTAK
ncbi:MAG TPA: hypothetical protein VNP73_10485 [Actinomycetota bacterium]|nr:hypothetical protein [Actinomycetota bacterium]